MATAFTFQKDGSDITDLVLTPSDFTDGVWLSDEKSLTNITEVSVDIEYEDIDPDGADNSVDYTIHAVIQGKADNGKWYTLVTQLTEHNSTERAPVRRLVAAENPSDYEPDREFILPGIPFGEAVGISHAQVALPNDIRLCVVLGDKKTSPPLAPLDSFKLSASGVLR